MQPRPYPVYYDFINTKPSSLFPREQTPNTDSFFVFLKHLFIYSDNCPMQLPNAIQLPIAIVCEHLFQSHLYCIC